MGRQVVVRALLDTHAFLWWVADKRAPLWSCAQRDSRCVERHRGQRGVRLGNRHKVPPRQTAGVQP